MRRGLRNAGAFVLLGALFGSTFPGIKTGLADLPALFYASLRFDLAVVALFALLVATRATLLPRSRRDIAAIAVSGVFIVAANNGLLFLGQNHLSPGAAAILYSLAPLITPVFAVWLLDDEAISPRGVAGLLVGLVGVVVIVRPDPSAWATGAGLGQVLLLSAACAVAAGSVLLRRVEPSMPKISMTAWAMALGAVLLHAASYLTGEAPALAATSQASWLSLAWVAIPGTAVAYTLYFDLLDRVGAIRSSLITYVVPVFAALGGWLVFGDVIDPWTALGFLIVVAGFAVLHWPALSTLARRAAQAREARVDRAG